MDITAITAIISVAAALSGIALGWAGRARTVRQDVSQDAETITTLKNDLGYIRSGVDDIRFEQRMQSQRIDALSERVTRNEESAKQAHKRIDRIEEMEGRG
ncbi:hypothetical protein MKZ15_15310 [Paenibacillus sp. FSL R7-0216]|uniref:hypothetical protein n=1 Tax=Paenibacillus sp. FSL R7-0216 TaxID=2921677 RepID=UPI0030DABC8C